MQPTIIIFPVDEWAKKSADRIHTTVRHCLETSGTCSVILTGGRSAEQLYHAWAEIDGFQHLQGVRFYFGDERCVPPDHAESNYGMVMRSLFGQKGIPAGCSVWRMEGETSDKEDAAFRYGEILPNHADVLLLGVGEDGHIASLFPGSSAMRETNQHVVPVTGPKPPNERITITPPFIRQAQSLFVLAKGAEKAAVLQRAMNQPENVLEYPARLVLNAIWFLDVSLPSVVDHSLSFTGNICQKP